MFLYWVKSWTLVLYQTLRNLQNQTAASAELRTTTKWISLIQATNVCTQISWHWTKLLRFLYLKPTARCHHEPCANAKSKPHLRWKRKFNTNLRSKYKELQTDKAKVNTKKNRKYVIFSSCHGTKLLAKPEKTRFQFPWRVPQICQKEHSRKLVRWGSNSMNQWGAVAYHAMIRQAASSLTWEIGSKLMYQVLRIGIKSQISLKLLSVIYSPLIGHLITANSNKLTQKYLNKTLSVKIRELLRRKSTSQLIILTCKMKVRSFRLSTKIQFLTRAFILAFRKAKTGRVDINKR